MKLKYYKQLLTIVKYLGNEKRLQVLLNKLFKRSQRIRTSTYLQMESAECGAVALAIVFDYYGLHIPLETLRVECGVSEMEVKPVTWYKWRDVMA